MRFPMVGFIVRCFAVFVVVVSLGCGSSKDQINDLEKKLAESESVAHRWKELAQRYQNNDKDKLLSDIDKLTRENHQLNSELKNANDRAAATVTANDLAVASATLGIDDEIKMWKKFAVAGLLRLRTTLGELEAAKARELVDPLRFEEILAANLDKLRGFSDAFKSDEGRQLLLDEVDSLLKESGLDINEF